MRNSLNRNFSLTRFIHDKFAKDYLDIAFLSRKTTGQQLAFVNGVAASDLVISDFLSL